MNLNETRILGYAYILLLVITFGVHVSFFVVITFLPAMSLISHKRYEGESEKAERARLICKKIILLAGYLFLFYEMFFAPPNKFAAFFFIYVPIIQAGAMILTQLILGLVFKTGQANAGGDSGIT